MLFSGIEIIVPATNKV